MPVMNACLACRKMKMKCVSTRQHSPCDRCVRLELQCVFRAHCRGRKPGMRLSRKEQKPASARIQTEQSGVGESDLLAVSDGFQPNGLLNRAAMKDKFSMQNILSVGHEAPDLAPDEQAILQDDPIACGLINTQVALSFLDYFMQSINPYISQLDPTLHSFAFLRRSPFLFTAVLSAAAKAFQSALYPTLHSHAESLFAEHFRRGEKSTEIIQAILLLTYWKEPNDTRAWTSVGLAIRMAMDLNWHKLSPRTKHGLNEIQRRETRNVERTFLVLFVYDRSLSLQTGKPYMIERTELIDVVDSWWKDPLANPNDQLLCAFVALRLLTADTYDLLTRTSSQTDGLLRILDHRIDKWQEKWLGIVSSRASSESPGCHPFLIRFYGAHLRLQLFSVRLQGNRLHDLASFWISYQSALAMMQLVTESSSLLYLAQDSVHVMTAYAAIFLIKVLLSSPREITQESGPAALKAIRAAADTFFALSAPPNSSCAFQARFLDRILQEYARLRGISHRSNHVGIDASGPNILLREEPASAQVGSPDPCARSSLTPSRSTQALAPGTGPRPRDSTRASAGMERCPNTPSALEMDEQGLGFLFEEGTWDDMFAGAGFSVHEGVFFS